MAAAAAAAVAQVTPGAVAAIAEHGDGKGMLQPVLQLLDVRMIKNPSIVRYRMELSDGVYSLQALLTAGENRRARDGSIRNGSIICLREFTCNTVHGRRIIIVLKFDILQSEHGIKGRQARLRISLYADDAVIFTNPRREDISCIMQIMKAFGEATGLQINMQKSTIATIRCADINMDDILQDFEGQRVSFPMQYLGLPLTLGRLKMVHLQFIQDRARRRVAGWQGRLLNVAGRRELIRSVLSSLPVYLLTVVKAPKNFIKELDKLRRRFLWAGDKELSGGKCKVSWVKVCAPTVNGGLGIIELERFSRALRLRWLWYSWDTRDRPWKGLELPVDQCDAALFHSATMVALGNGERANFWCSRWLQRDSPACLFPNLFRHTRKKNRTVKEALSNENWIRDVDYSLTQTLIEEFTLLWIKLQDVVLVPAQEDTITWLHNANGQYSASSAYRLQFSGMTTSMSAAATWKTKAPPKCKFFTWLMLQNRIWTAARLLIREWPNDYFCPLCIRNLETVNHLFQECWFTRLVWDKMGVWIHEHTVRPMNWKDNNSDLNQWYIDLGSSCAAGRRSGVRSIIMLTNWEIWKERNNRVFQKAARSPEQVFRGIQEEAKIWLRAGIKDLELVLPTAGQAAVPANVVDLTINHVI